MCWITELIMCNNVYRKDVNIKWKRGIFSSGFRYLQINLVIFLLFLASNRMRKKYKSYRTSTWKQGAICKIYARFTKNHMRSCALKIRFWCALIVRYLASIKRIHLPLWNKYKSAYSRKKSKLTKSLQTLRYFFKLSLVFPVSPQVKVIR